MQWLASRKAAERLRPTSKGAVLMRLSLDPEDTAKSEVVWKPSSAGKHPGGLGLNHNSMPAQLSPKARLAEDAQTLLPFNPLKRKGCNFSLAEALLKNEDQVEPRGFDTKASVFRK